MDDKDLYEKARKRVQMKRGFAVHLVMYVVVNTALVVIWMLTGKGYPWPLWPIAGWGVGIIANAIALIMELLAPEDRAIEREMRRLHH